MSITDFTSAATKNFETFRSHPVDTNGIGSLDAAYTAAIRAARPRGHPHIYGRILLVCHKHMLSAANLIASCLPEDSVGITRRAVEAAKVATAIHLNDENVQAWLSYDERTARWLKRQAEEKPKPFYVKYDDIKGDEHCQALDKWIGVLSDAYVHFTPEYYGTLSWEVHLHDASPGGDIFLNFFQPSTREIERHFLLLMAVHGKILQALDRCVDGNLYSQLGFKAALDSNLGHSQVLESRLWTKIRCWRHSERLRRVTVINAVSYPWRSALVSGGSVHPGRIAGVI